MCLLDWSVLFDDQHYFGVLYIVLLYVCLSMWKVDVAICMEIIVLFVYRVQFGSGCGLGQKIFFQWLSMYWAYRNFSMLFVRQRQGAFHK